MISPKTLGVFPLPQAAFPGRISMSESGGGEKRVPKLQPGLSGLDFLSVSTQAPFLVDITV